MTGKALIIDDDEAVRFVVRQALIDDGWTVVELDDGSEAEPSFAANAFDLVVLDLYMPGMNGFEVLRRLRRYKALTAPAWKTRADVPVLVVSGEAQEGGLSFAQRVGANACLSKPFDVSELQRTARELFQVGRRRVLAAPPRARPGGSKKETS